MTCRCLCPMMQQNRSQRREAKGWCLGNMEGKKQPVPRCNSQNSQIFYELGTILSRCEQVPLALDHLPPCLLATANRIPSSHLPEEILPPHNCLLSDIWPQREFCLFLGSPSLCGCPYSVQHTQDSFEARGAAVGLLLS